MASVSARGLRVAFGAGEPLLDGVQFHVEAGERVALVGRNGSGKSTLMRIVAGEIEPDTGEVSRAVGLRVARLAQEVPAGMIGDTFEIVSEGLGDSRALLSEYHRLSRSLDAGRDLDRLHELQAEIEAAGAWHHEQRVERVLSRLRLPANERFETLSGGLKRRVLLAQALVAEPDLLLLDEPTNHLDIESIEWLEELLSGSSMTLLFVTHDRAFLRRLATRILELDRGRLFDWPGDYDRYQERKRQALAVEAVQNTRLDRKLAAEETWVRRGLKARRTRNEGRVRALERLREERRVRRAAVGRVKLAVDGSERSGKIVIEAEDMTFAHPDAEGTMTSPVISDLSTTIIRGDKVGILGPNGSGKTTLLQLLLGELAPDRGTIRHGTKLEVVSFDQHREQLDDEVSVADSVADGNDQVEVGGRVRHVVSYLGDFLFPPAQARSPVRSLSGGERNRLLLARLFTRPCNVLVMDEPTNDLDVETLELLEALLVEFEGTLLLVSHDRAFLDHVVTSTLVMEGGGRVVEYAGGYEDWLVQRRARETATSRAPRQGRASGHRERRAKDARRLSYKESREYEALPGQIEALEGERDELHRAFADPEFFAARGSDGAVRAHERLAALEKTLGDAYERWVELAEIAGDG